MAKKNGWATRVLFITGIIIFAVITYVIVRSTSTVVAVVPNKDIAAGTKIEASMIQTINVPVNTPKGYITDASSLIGQKLKVTVGSNQLLYINNVMSSWEDFSSGESIPADYVVTSIQIPQERAVGGLITAGDVIDILGVPNNNYITVDKVTMATYLGSVADKSYGAEGINLYWVLSNVKVLETDSSLSESTDSSISVISTDENNSTDGNYYIIALSYSDYQKLRLCEQYLNLWLDIAPTQNSVNPPLLDIMQGSVLSGLADSRTQSIFSTNTTNIVTPTGTPTATPNPTITPTTAATTAIIPSITDAPTITEAPTATPKPK